MSRHGNPDDAPLDFGRTEPPRLFDEEPTIVVFDLHDFIDDLPVDLRPFHNMIVLIRDENALHHRLSHFNQLFTVASILPQWRDLETQTFVQQNLVPFDRVRSIYLFYIDAQLDHMLAIFPNRIDNCFPITSQIPARIRVICALINDANIAYCDDQHQRNEARGDTGMANSYAIQKYNRLALQLEYNELLQRQLDEPD